VSPYLIVDDATKAIDFYTQVLGGVERMRMPAPQGRIGHAEIAFGESVVMLADEFPDMGIRSAKSIGDTPVTIALYVQDVDATFQAALTAGAKEVRPVENKFYGDRAGQVEDPWGQRWDIMTHVEDVSPDEMMTRMQQAMPG
jgi:PhnB protein